MSRKLQKKFDSIDFTQSAWQTMFESRADLYRFDDQHKLVAYLIGAAKNKIREAARRHGRVDELSLDDMNLDGDDSPGESAVDIADAGPAVIDVAIAREELERLLTGLSPLQRRIIELRIDGLSNEQIARSLAVTPGAVHRCLKQLSEKHS